MSAVDAEILSDVLLRLEELSEASGETCFERLVSLDEELQARLAGDRALAESAEQRLAALKAFDHCLLSMESNVDAPSDIPGYEILEEIGRGGIGCVYRARQRAIGRIVAVKMLLAGQLAGTRLRRRFSFEAAAIGRLQHPNIVQVFDSGEVNGLAYLALEYVGGGNLAQRLDRRPQSQSVAAKLIIQLAEAVQFAHARGIVHRDLKPSNILIAENDSPKIADFGLARLLEDGAELTRTGEAPGTPSYMAPEQVRGDTSRAVDVYALGAILYEMLTGRPPFLAATAMATLDQVQTCEAMSPRLLVPGIARDLETICLKCLDKTPARRYETARALAADLQRFLNNEPIVARPLGPIGKLNRWVRRKPWVAALTGVSFSSIGAILLLTLVTSSRLADAAREAERARDDAEFQRSEAELRGQESDARRQQVEAEQLRTRRLLYAADMVQVDRALKQRQAVVAQGLLDRYQPAEGERDLRGFVWHYLNPRSHGDHLCLRGHAGEVFSAVFSPDGQTIASCGRDGTIRLWNAATGKQLRTIAAHDTDVNNLAFSPDGATLFSIGDDARLQSWNVSDGSRKTQVELRKRSETQLAMLASGDQLLIAPGPEALFFDTQMLQQARELRITDESIESLAAASNGDLIATGTYIANTREHALRLWNAFTLEPVSEPMLHKGRIHDIALSRDGSLVATAVEFDAIRIWSTTTSSEVCCIKPTSGCSHGLAFSHDGSSLVTGGHDGVIHVWDAATGRLRHSKYGHTGIIWSLTFAPDGSRLVSASADGTVRTWDLSPQDPRQVLPIDADGVEAIAFSPDGKLLLAARTSGELTALETANWTIANRWLAHKGSALALSIAPNGQVASAGADCRIRLWNAATAKCQGELRPSTYTAIGQLSLSFSADGRRLAFCGLYGHCKLYDFANDDVVSIGSWTNPRHARFSGQASALVLAGDRLAFYDVPNCEPRPGPEIPFTLGLSGGACFSRDGAMLGTGHADRTIRLWKSQTGESLGSLIGAEAPISALAFCPDGQTLASGDELGNVQVWDVFSQQAIFTQSLHSGPVSAIEFSPDGRLLVSAGVSASGGGEIWVCEAEPLTFGHPADEPFSESPHRRPTISMDNRMRPVEPANLFVSGSEYRLFEHYRQMFKDWRDVHSISEVIPTFEERVVDGESVYGALSLSKAAVAKTQMRGAGISRFGDQRESILSRIRTANERPAAKLFGGVVVWAIQGFEGSELCDVTIFERDAVERVGIPASDLPCSYDLPAHFRDVHRWAKARGYAGGYPTFQDQSEDGNVTFGAILIKPGLAQEIWVSTSELDEAMWRHPGNREWTLSQIPAIRADALLKRKTADSGRATPSRAQDD